MILIVGLGNPGKEYTDTRHNIGFAVIDELASGTGSGNKYSKFNSIVYDAEISGTRLLLLKPQTFMNNSGSTVAAVLRSYGEEMERILVVHDDIDIEFGQIKLKNGGSTAGHRGLESIYEKTRTLDFDRLRFGIGRPPGRMEASDYVLRRFTRSELEEAELMVKRSADAISDYITGGIDFASNKYN